MRETEEEKASYVIRGPALEKVSNENEYECASKK